DVAQPARHDDLDAPTLVVGEQPRPDPDLAEEDLIRRREPLDQEPEAQAERGTEVVDVRVAVPRRLDGRRARHERPSTRTQPTATRVTTVRPEARRPRARDPDWRTTSAPVHATDRIGHVASTR